MMKHAGRALVACGLLAVMACGEQSRVDPNATITVTGAVLASDGNPAAERPVKLGVGVNVSDGAFAVLTVGLSCTTGACRGDLQDAMTDEAGGYAFTLQGSDTQSSFGEAESVLVSVTGEPRAAEVSGPMASARFVVQTETISLPTLALVDPGLALEARSEGVEARWTTERAGPYELTFERGANVPVWLERTAASPVTVDARLLEDTAGRAVVAGVQEGTAEGSPVELHWRSPGFAYASGAGAPPSRGRSCTWVDGQGMASQRDATCALTDGDLVAAALNESVCRGTEGAESCEAATAVSIDLGSPVPAELVVVRGCEGGCAVEVSTDGTTFAAAGGAADGFGAVQLNGAPISAVRVGVGTGGLREVSVWGPLPERPLLPMDDATQAELAAPYGHGSAGDSSPSPLVVALAVAIAAAVLVGVGVALGRRKGAAAA